MSRQLKDRDTINYAESVVRPPYTDWSFVRRFFVFQNERVPLIALGLMGTLLAAGIAHANGRFEIRSFAVSSIIIVLYFLEIRLADEPKDYEHDVAFYPDRPVQRGLISLKELALVNKFVIAGSFIAGLTTGSPQVLACACLLQAYAFLTRREFYIRDWLRDHFLTYQFVHYFQLLILDWLILTVLDIQPVREKVLYFCFAVLMIAVFETSRTIGDTQNEQSKDRYSARLGPIKALAIHVIVVIAAIAYTSWLIARIHGDNHWYLLAAGTAVVAYGAWKYLREATEHNANVLNQCSLVMYLAATLTLALA